MPATYMEGQTEEAGKPRSGNHVRAETFLLAPEIGLRGRLDLFWQQSGQQRLLELKTGGGQGNLQIWMQPVSGGSPVRLTNDPADDHEPAIAPNGSTVAFRSERDGGGIYLVPAAYLWFHRNEESTAQEVQA